MTDKLPEWFAEFPFLTPAAMLVGIYWMLATDRLVTGASHRRELAEKDQRILDRDKIIDKQERVIEVRDEQVKQMAVVGEAFVKIMNAIESLAKREEKRVERDERS